MKKIVNITLIIAALTLTFCSNKKGDLYISVTGNDCNNLYIKLYRYQNDSLALVDMSKFDMGHARLKGTVVYPELMYMYIENAPDYLPIFVEEGHIDVDVNYAKPSRSVVSGSESHKLFTDFLQSYNGYSDKMSRLIKNYQSASNNGDTVMMEQLLNEQELIRQETTEYEKKFVSIHIAHPISCYIISKHLMHGIPEKELSSLLDSVPQDNRNNIYYKRAVEYLHNHQLQLQETLPETIQEP